MDEHRPDGVERSVEDGNSMFAENALEFLGEALDVRKAYGGGRKSFFLDFACVPLFLICQAGSAL